MVLGVDPGVKGGWALIEVDEFMGHPALRAFGRFPLLYGAKDRIDLQKARDAILGHIGRRDVMIGVLENVGAAPGQGVASSFTFGHAAGAIEGLLVGMGCWQVAKVAPATWKAAFGLPGGQENKAKSVALAEKITERLNKPMGRPSLDEHTAEAFLMAWWFIREEVRRRENMRSGGHSAAARHAEIAQPAMEG